MDNTVGSKVYLNAPQGWYRADIGSLQDGATTYGQRYDLGQAMARSQYSGHQSGQKQYELSDHLGNVLATVLDRKVGVGQVSNPDYPTTSSAQLRYDHWDADIASVQDYYPFGMPMDGGTNTARSYSSEKLKHGYNGQRKDDEVYGVGMLNTAQFWEYDTRLGRRWNLDPIDQISISNYATFANNPIITTDALGNTVKTTQEGAGLVKEGLQRTLGSSSSLVGFNIDEGAERGELTFDEEGYQKMDKSALNPTQSDILNRYRYMIQEKSKTVDLRVVDRNEKISDNLDPSTKKSMSLEESSKHGANGVSMPYGSSLDNVSLVKAYVARNPNIEKKDAYGKVVNDPMTGKPIQVEAPSYTNKITTFHEVLGHAYYWFTQGVKSDNNDKTDNFENKVRKIYIENGAPVGGFSSGH